MSLLTTSLLLGVSCDVRSCETEQRVDPVPAYGPEADRVLGGLLCSGWARRSGRSVWWYCPAHADRASRCLKGAWGRCSPWCPVHGSGQVATWATEDARRLQGLDNMLTRMDQARDR